MNVARKSLNAIALSSLVVSLTAFGEIKNDTAITIDFQGRQIQFFGIYNPGKASQKAQGLDAEIAARRNGIAHLTSYLSNSCGGSQSAEESKSSSSPSWQGVVKSQGSEIYSNGVLKISLVAPLKDVLKGTAKGKSTTLKSKDGAPLALRIPRIPASALKCGMLTLSVAGRTIPLNPLSGSSESGAKVVNLILEGSSTVKPSGAGDIALLEGSNLFQTAEPEENQKTQSTAKETQNPAPAAAAPVQTQPGTSGENAQPAR
ncbi:MAG: hypothetical protein ACO3A4_06680 [Silvanigrellaceae bacterium]